MAGETLSYKSTGLNLFVGNWTDESYIVGAQLCSSSYVYSSSHTTRADLSGTVATPVLLTNKTLTELDSGLLSGNSDPINFTTLGVLTGSWVIIHEMLTGSPKDTDKLLFAIKLNTDVIIDDVVAAAINIASTGLFSLIPSDYVPPVVVPPVDPGTGEVIKACTIGKTINNPELWEPGDVICVTDFQIDGGIDLRDLNFPDSNRVTIRTVNNTKLVRTAQSGSSFYMNECQGIDIEGGFDCFGGLYGFRAVDCDRIKITDMVTHDIGQEGITFFFTRAGAFNDIKIIRPKVYNTGQRIKNFGEAIYIGNGTLGLHNLCSVTGVYIENVDLKNISAEAIDIKAQVLEWEVNGGVIDGVELPFNGVITYGTEAAIPANGNGIVRGGLITRNVTNRSGFSFSHYAFGQGNVQVLDACMESGGGSTEYGISIYKTFGNQNSRTITVSNKAKFVGPSEKRIRLNTDDAGTGAELPGILAMIESGTPVIWYDASDTDTLTVSGDKVTQWRDKSGNDYHLNQADSTKQPITSLRSIATKNALFFDGINDYMSSTNGPQFLLNSMLFVVVDADVVADSQHVVSISAGATRKIGAGFAASEAFFTHSEAGSGTVAGATARGLVVFACYKNGTSQTVRQNGAFQTLTNATDTSNNLDSWLVGSKTISAEFFKGAIAEIRAFDYYDAAEFSAIEDELQLKWGYDSSLDGADKDLDIASYNPALWFDASDASTITSLTNEVSEWRDKSGNNRHLSQGTGAQRPGTGLHTVNGLNVITIENDNYMTLSTAVTVKYCIAAFRFEGLASDEFVVMGGTPAATPRVEARWQTPPLYPQISFDGVGSATGAYAINGETFRLSNENHAVTAMQPDQNHVVTFKSDVAFANTEMIGKSAGPTSGRAYLCEIVWFATDIAEADRENIEKYMSDKWGGSV